MRTRASTVLLLNAAKVGAELQVGVLADTPTGVPARKPPTTFELLELPTTSSISRLFIIRWRPPERDTFEGSDAREAPRKNERK